MHVGSAVKKRWPWLLLATIVLLAWGQSVTFQFVWDDQYFIQDLKSIRSLTFAPEMFYRLDAQSSYPEGFVLFRPLRTLHHAILFAMGGGETPKPWLFHLANLAWHCAASILLYELLLLLLGRESRSEGTNIRWIALLGATAFAVHPVVSEVVCWAKSLDDLMAATFVLASCCALLRWEPERPSQRAYLCAVLFFALAVYSKESAVPFALFCIPFLAWRTQRSWTSVLRLSAPFLIVAVLFVVHRHLVIGRTSQTAPLSGSYAQTLIDTLPAGPIYARLLAGVPPFCIDYSYMKAGHGLTSPTVMFGIVILIAVTAACALCFHRRLLLVGAGSLWLLLFMLPFSNVVPMMQFCAERFLYLPMLGVVVALAAFVALAHRRRLVMNFSVVIVIAWAALAWNRSWIWRDGVTLFVRSHIEGPTSSRLQDNAIAAVFNQPHMHPVFALAQRPAASSASIPSPAQPLPPENWELIEATLTQLQGLFPSNATVNSAFAISKARQGKAKEAIPYFLLAAQQQPKDALMWNNLGQAWIEAGEFDRAQEAYCQASALTQ
ncbi:MAG TPA: hypothetical protein VNT99_08560 [Methylomirabilota bacterium]|nr:hypothetical protein [Methylomirabilota bacterium]